MVGKKYKHKNGNIYTVLHVTNTFGGKGGPMERLKDHPIDVVYQGDNGYVWSRRLSDWNRSFTEVAPIEEKEDKYSIVMYRFIGNNTYELTFNKSLEYTGRFIDIERGLNKEFPKIDN